jgi:hypothetical protein
MIEKIEAALSIENGASAQAIDIAGAEKLGTSNNTQENPQHPAADDDHDRGCVLQFEIDRKRWRATHENDRVGKYATPESPMDRVRYIAQTAINDVIRNGGTFVFVATADKITMVQRPEAANLGEAEQKPEGAPNV